MIAMQLYKPIGFTIFIRSNWPACAAMSFAAYATASKALPVEDKYKVAGPSTVVQASVADQSGQTYTLYYPSDIASDGFLNPLITWGNGSGQTCTTEANSKAFGQQLASWGFVVICANTPTSGFGKEVWAGAQYMIAENNKPGSIFQGLLDVDKIGASGHSQGATGALNANVLSKGVIKSTMTLAFVDPWLHSPRSQRPVLAEVKGPVFLASGGGDLFTFSQSSYFGQLPTPAAKGALRYRGHDGMLKPSLAYVVAWFMYTLRDDAFARSAFVKTNGAEPEVSRNPAWNSWASKTLP